jgi:hypothetical protein
MQKTPAFKNNSSRVQTNVQNNKCKLTCAFSQVKKMQDVE